jgi:transposase
MRELSALIAWLCGRNHRSGSREPKGECPLPVIFDRDKSSSKCRHIACAANSRSKFRVLGKRNRKDPICFSPYLYRARNLIERFFNKIKQCRRVATRYGKLAAGYLAFVKLASIRIWLRANESAP